MQEKTVKATQRHVIVDIETLGTDSNSFITDVVAVEYIHGNDSLKVGEIYMSASFDPWAEQVGAVIDPATFVWRQKQCEATKKTLRHPAGCYRTLESGLTQLRKFIGDSPVWANAPDFDLVILNNAAKRLGLEPIAPYYNHRCVRTAKMALEEVHGNRILLSNPHQPLEDCRNQLIFIVKPYLEMLDELRTARSRKGKG